MKKTYILLLLASIFTACNIDVDQLDTVRSDLFYAQFEQPTSETKVYVDNRFRVLWNENDEVVIFNKYTYGDRYRFMGSDGDNAGTFSCMSGDDFVTGNPLDSIYAVYPYSENTSISNDGVISVVLPSIQTYREKSFGAGANTMVSKTDNNSLMFRNVCGYLSFKFYGKGSVSSIELQGNNGEKLAGAANVTIGADGIPSVNTVYLNSNTLQLVFAEPIALSAEAADYTEFWFVVPPITFENGFTVTVKGVDRAYVKKSVSQSITIQRNRLTHMAPLELDLSAPEWTNFGHATFHEGWWGQDHTANIKYYEVEDGVRFCVAECDEGTGIWGDDQNTTIQFTWYTQNTNSAGYQLVAIPKQYIGYDYSDWASKPAGEAVYPIYLYDFYTYWIERGESFGSFLEFAAKYGDIQGTYPVSYYDGNGGFYFNARYFIPGVGGFSPDPFELVAIVDGFRAD